MREGGTCGWVVGAHKCLFISQPGMDACSSVSPGWMPVHQSVRDGCLFISQSGMETRGPLECCKCCAPPSPPSPPPRPPAPNVCVQLFKILRCCDTLPSNSPCTNSSSSASMPYVLQMWSPANENGTISTSPIVQVRTGRRSIPLTVFAPVPAPRFFVKSRAVG